MPGEVFDLNDAAAQFAVNFLERAIPRTEAAVARALGSTPAIRETRIRALANKTIVDLRRINILIAKDPVDIDEVYQPSFFRSRNEEVDEITLRKIITPAGLYVICGNAGLGKTMFLKRHAIRRIEERIILPIFISLRRFNSFEKTSFFEFVNHQLLGYANWLSLEMLSTTMLGGVVELLLDGVDEVNFARREDVNNGIDDIAKSLRRTRIIITGRPGDRFPNPSRTTEVLYLLPMRRDATISMLRSEPFKGDASEALCKRISAGDHDHFADVVSNPLMASIMILTYERWGEEQNSIHLFFRQAYETLYARHDVNKDQGSRRQHVSGLNIIEMADIIGYVSAVTYATSTFVFSETHLTSLLWDVTRSRGMEVDCEGLKDDLIEGLSIITRVGLDLQFTHRTFQEYFCAEFIVRSPSNLSYHCINAAKSRFPTDYVIGMSYALNPSRLREVWAIPTLESYRTLIATSAVEFETPYMGIQKVDGFEALATDLAILNTVFNCGITDLSVSSFDAAISEMRGVDARSEHAALRAFTSEFARR